MPDTDHKSDHRQPWRGVLALPKARSKSRLRAGLLASAAAAALFAATLPFDPRRSTPAQERHGFGRGRPNPWADPRALPTSSPALSLRSSPCGQKRMPPPLMSDDDEDSRSEAHRSRSSSKISVAREWRSRRATVTASSCRGRAQASLSAADGYIVTNNHVVDNAVRCRWSPIVAAP